MRANFRRIVGVVTLACSLAACGGGGGGDTAGGAVPTTAPAPAPTPPPAPSPSPVPTPPPAAAPSALDYPTQAVFVVGTPRVVTPTVVGTVTQYVVAPALPPGLALDRATGTVAGTATAVVATAVYTITASNSAGSASDQIEIVVNPAAPQTIVYASPQRLTVGAAVSIVPTVTGGPVAQWSITPALPGGLGFNAQTGAITGTPNTARAEAPYSVRASNVTGAATFVLTLAVVPAPVTPAPTVTIAATPSTVDDLGTVTLSWASTNATSCAGNGVWGSRTLGPSGSASFGPVQFERGPTQIFGVSCSGPSGTASASARVAVRPPAPAVSLSADRTIVRSGGLALVSFRVQGADTCTTTGDWSLSITPRPGTESVGGIESVGPITRNSAFTLACTNATATTSRTVAVALETGSNQPPVAVADAITVDEDSGDVTIGFAELLANDTDPEGRIGPLYYTEWDTVSGRELIEFEYAPTRISTYLGFRLRAELNGTIVLRYRFEDDVGNKSNWANVVVTVRPIDDTPVAVDDRAEALRNIRASVNVLANDRGLDAPLTLEIVSPPANGTTEIVPNAGYPLVRYSPRVDFEGGDTLRYRLRDADGDTAEATLTISVNPTWRISPAKRFARWAVQSPEAWTCNSAGATAQARLWTREIYARFKDSFDFIVILSNTFATCRFGIAGQQVSAKSDVSGIGLPITDSTASFGSGGQLRGVIWFPGIDALYTGPALHEFAHNWAQFVYTSSLGPHWGFASGGQLGGFDRATLRDLGGGRWQASSGGFEGFGLNANNGNGVPFGDLELYLMGMRPPAEVGDLVRAEGAAWVDGARGIFSATAVTRTPIGQLVAQLGARSPAFPAAPRTFRVLTVVATAVELNDEQWARVDRHVELFGRPASDGDARWFNFWEATGGAGRLLMENVDAELK